MSTIFLLEKKIEEQKIKGFKGILIDYLTFPSELNFAFDIASKNKFFSIITDT